MRYLVTLTTRSGDEKEVKEEGESIEDVKIKIKKKFPGAFIECVHLIPQKKGNIVLYGDGEQYEASPSVLYEHFK